MQQYERVLSDKDYNPNAAYQQLQQQIQKQILQRQKLQQQQQQQQTELHALKQNTQDSAPSTSNNQQYAVVSTKEFFSQNAASENDSAVLSLQQDISLSSLDEVSFITKSHFMWVDYVRMCLFVKL